jgi:superfamily II DNA or RNA helicase
MAQGYSLIAPGGVELWPHQRRARRAVLDALAAGRTEGLLVLPTGAGKTICFLTVARDLDLPALVLVHRDELVQQTLRALELVWPRARAGVIQAQRDEWHNGEQVVVASVQSLHARRRGRMPRDRFGFLVVDEAHHTASPTYSSILDYFDRRRFLLGVTATPKRLDGVGLCHWYGDEPLFSYSIRAAVRDGILVPPVQYQVRTEVDLDRVASRGGDFVEGDLARAVNTPERNRAVVEAFCARAPGRKAITFCVDVQHARDLAGAFGAAGVRAAVVTGDVDLRERRVLLGGLAAGEFRVVTTCILLTEGFDDKSIDCVVMARPTYSHSLYIQYIGRGLRRCDATGKKDCLILDVTDNCQRHKLVSADDLLDAEEREGTQKPVEEEEEEQEEEDAAAAEDEGPAHDATAVEALTRPGAPAHVPERR